MVRRTVKQAIRFPSTAMNALTESDTVDFINKYVKLVSNSAKANLPPAILTIANLLVLQTPFGSLIDYLNSSKKRKE